jgi:hypothetical protein
MESMLLILLENPLASLIDKQPSSALNSWGSQLVFTEHHIHRIHDSAKLVHGIKEGALTHPQVLAKDIARNSIRKHANSYGIFLVKDEA